MAHSFVVVGMSRSEPINIGATANERTFSPQIVDYYPEIYEDKSTGQLKEKFMYL